MPRPKKAHRLHRDYVTREVWAHNAHLGRVRMARVAMNAILESPLTTVQARRTAQLIRSQLDLLHKQLQVRIDPPSAFTDYEPLF